MSRFRTILLPEPRDKLPWGLQEWIKPRWAKPGEWVTIFRASTKDAAEKHMMGIVEGERKTAPTYYDSFGNPDNY